MLSFEDFRGRRVCVTFREPIKHNGCAIKKVFGIFGGVAANTFALNNISEALDDRGKDVVKKAALLNQNIVGPLMNILSLESHEAIDDDDDDD